MAWRQIISHALRELRFLTRELGRDPTGACYAEDVAALVLQIEDTRRALREVCERHGDDSWSDGLHLADVVDKYLGRVLDAKAER